MADEYQGLADEDTFSRIRFCDMAALELATSRGQKFTTGTQVVYLQQPASEVKHTYQHDVTEIVKIKRAKMVTAKVVAVWQTVGHYIAGADEDIYLELDNGERLNVDYAIATDGEYKPQP